MVFKRLAFVAACHLFTLLIVPVAMSQLAPAMAAGKKRPVQPIRMERQGSFTAGGTVIGNAAAETLHCDHGHVDYQIPVHARRTALFLWHSSSMHVWQQRWDGGEGFRSLMLRRGFPIYLWDGPRVGRGNWGCESYDYKPFIGQNQRSFISWRFGPALGTWFPNVQFPKDDPAALEQALSARYAEFDITRNAVLEAAAAAGAIDRIGPSILVTNSAGGLRALLATLKSDNIKAIIAYESPAYVFPEGEGPEQQTGQIESVHVPLSEFKKLTRIPIQIVWGDNTEKSYWTAGVALSRQFVALVNAHGGRAELLMLPDAGLVGNTHIPFADLNNVQVADQLSMYLRRHRLDQR
jgi:hypothetical protein